MLVELINNLQKPLPGDVGLLLRESFFCGREDSGVLVCCPRTGVIGETELRLGLEEPEPEGKCQLQHGRAASCVSYNSCKPFSLMLGNLRKPFPEAVPLIMKEVFLCGSDSSTGISIPKICCPNDALSPGGYVQTTGPATEAPVTTTTTTTQAPVPWYEEHAGYSQLASPDICGRSLVLMRIVGGKNASLGQYPWLANIGYEVSNGDVEFKCGASLIGPRFVMTAAHCVIGLPRSYKFTTVRVGEWDLGKEEDCEEGYCAPPVQDFKPELTTPHPEYNKPKRFQNDIALIKLDRPVIENDYVSPICLPFPPFHPSAPAIGTAAVVAGWGAVDKFARRFSDVLQYVSVPVAESEVCVKKYKAQRVTLGSRQMCAGGVAGEDSCSGDSGSALMLDVINEARPYDPRIVQVGIVSFGPRRCASKGVPAIYTRVQAYMEWLLDTTLL